MELISHLLICHFVCLHLILPRGIGRFLSLEKNYLTLTNNLAAVKIYLQKKHIITKTQVTWISSVHLLRLSITFRLSSQLSVTVVLHWKSHLRDVLALKIQVFSFQNLECVFPEWFVIAIILPDVFEVVQYWSSWGTVS